MAEFPEENKSLSDIFNVQKKIDIQKIFECFGSGYLNKLLLELTDDPEIEFNEGVQKLSDFFIYLLASANLLGQFRGNTKSEKA